MTCIRKHLRSLLQVFFYIVVLFIAVLNSKTTKGTIDDRVFYVYQIAGS